MKANAIQSHLLAQPVGTGQFTGYARANNLRLAQLFSRQMLGSQKLTDLPALDRVQTTTGLHPAITATISPQPPKTLSVRDSDFLKDYRNNMLRLQRLAVQAQTDTAADPLAAGAQDPTVLQAKGKLAQAQDEYQVEVQQLASGQTLRSQSLRADEPLPTMSGSLRLETEKGSFDLYLSAAGLEDNEAMLQNFAQRINDQDTGVVASVQRQRDGSVSLQLAAQVNGLSAASQAVDAPTATETATAKAAAATDAKADADRAAASKAQAASDFQVKGTLAGRLGFTQTAAAGENKAIYTVRKNGGQAQRFTADTNTVQLDKDLTATFKKVGSTTITAAASAAEHRADKLAELVDGYNDTVRFLRQNSEHSTGALNQLRRMTGADDGGDSLRQLGIETQRDGTLRLDRSRFLRRSASDPLGTQRLVEDFAQALRGDAVQGMKESSGDLVSPLEYTQRFTDLQKAPINTFSSYTRNGVLNLMNLYAAGVLMNLNI